MTFDISVLDLVPVPSGTAPSSAVRTSLSLAQLAERCGYRRYWISEHHGMPAIASASPEVLLSRVGALTSHIRIGSGGIMLPNHSPMRVAEHFRTLEALYPGRIDLGIGRAPGSDARANRALHASSGEYFSEMLAEMLSLSAGDYPADHPFSGVRVMPDDVALPPIWILGSSGASAHLAGANGFGYSFASHFSPVDPAPALARYRDTFEPSRAFSVPHCMLGVSVICAESEAQAQYLAQTVDLMWLRLRKGEFHALPSPEEAAAYPYTAPERAAVDGNRSRHVIGTPEQVAERLSLLAEHTAADELMIVSNIHDPAARLRSYELVAESMTDRREASPARGGLSAA